MPGGGESFREAESKLSWLYRVADHCCFDRAVRRSRHAEVPLEDGPEPTAATGALAALEDWDLVSRFVSHLDARLQRVAVLHYLDGLSQKNMRIGCALVLSLLGAATGCGEGPVSSDYAPPYGVLYGEIAVQGAAPSKNVRAALAWYRKLGGDPSGPGAHAVMQTQDVGVSATFPASFQLNITQLPPPEALQHLTPAQLVKHGLSPSNAWAMGVVMVYEDQNGNGKLDFTPATASDIEDKLLGHPGDKQGQVSSNYELLYWEGPPPPQTYWSYDPTTPVLPGFNLVLHGAGNPLPKVVPLDTLLTIKLKGDPKLSCYLVEPLPEEEALPGDGVDVPFLRQTYQCVNNQPYPTGEPFCMGPLSIYFSRLVVEPSPAIKKLCGVAVETCVVQADPASTEVEEFTGPPPAGWPCAF